MFYIYKYGGMIVSPSYFEYPDYEELLKDENLLTTFFLGKSLLIAPAFSKDVMYECFFPKGTWLNINNMGDLIHSEG